MPPPKGRLPPPPSSIGQKLKLAAVSAAIGSRDLETSRSIIPPPPLKGSGVGGSGLSTDGGARLASRAPPTDTDGITPATDEGGYLDISPASDAAQAAEYEAPAIASKRAEFTVKVEATEGAEGYSITLGDRDGAVVIVELENVKAPYPPEVVRTSPCHPTFQRWHDT